MDKKVVLGLSGGVDSAVAARLLRGQGYQVQGLFLDIGNIDARNDAIAVADYLEIPLTVLDIGSQLEKFVCAPFAEAYLRGETPNPCILCNPAVKFKALCDLANEIGAEYIATGHYARAENGGLYKGKPSNDQSYMLCRILPHQLDRLLLPLGDFEKTQVRQMAEDMTLPVAQKPDSMEICFIADGDYAAFIERRGQIPPPGSFVDESSKVLGTHKGIHHYTVGQRRGLGIALGQRVFVSEIRPLTNEIVLSQGDELYTGEIDVSHVNWLLPCQGSFKAAVKVRHSKVETSAAVTPVGEGAHVVFDVPVRAPTAGQSAVFYMDDRLVGGGFIV